MAKPRDLEKTYKARRHWREKYPARSMIRLAKKRGHEVTVTEDDIQIPSHCPILGIPLEMGTRLRKDGSPSLDRVDTSKGYIKGNVEVISWRANRLKSDASLSEVKAIYDYMRKRLK